MVKYRDPMTKSWWDDVKGLLEANFNP